MVYYILITLYIIACLVLILFVLLQPSKSDASTVFGGGAGSAAFGPRGTQTVLAKVTIAAAVGFFLIAFLFSIPGLFDRKSIGEGVTGEEAPPAQSLPASPTDQTLPATVPPSDATQPATAPAPTADQGAKPAANATPQDAKKPEAAKPADAAKKPEAKPNANAPK